MVPGELAIYMQKDATGALDLSSRTKINSRMDQASRDKTWNSQTASFINLLHCNLLNTLQYMGIGGAEGIAWWLRALATLPKDLAPTRDNTQCLVIPSPGDPTLSLVSAETRTSMFMVSLFMITRKWKHPRYTSVNEWIMKIGLIYTIEFYSALR